MDNFHADTEGDDLLLSTLNSTIDGELRDAPSLVTSASNSLDTPLSFADFPYPSPYPQQLEFMRAVYSAIEKGQCGLFESPTGTGKTASLLTASLRWLLDNNARSIRRLDLLNQERLRLLANNRAEDACQENDTDWIDRQTRSRQRRLQLEPEIEELDQLKASLETIYQIKHRFVVNNDKLVQLDNIRQKTTLDPVKIPSTESLDHNQDGPESWLLDTNPDSDRINDDNGPLTDPQSDKSAISQVIFVSRTHSQLSQVASELKKSSSLFHSISSVQLASRQNLCTNSRIASLPSSHLINEACLDSGKSSQACPMRQRDKVDRLSSYLLSGRQTSLDLAEQVRDKRDVESLMPKGSDDDRSDKLAACVGCPYYATRKGLTHAQLVLAPFSTLLHAQARLASGLVDLTNSIVVIDEAHNLLEATAACLSTTLDRQDLTRVRLLFDTYLGKYRSRFAALTALRLRQLNQLISRLEGLLLTSSPKAANQRLITPNQLLVDAGVDNVNLTELVNFLNRRHFLAKLSGFAKWSSRKFNKENDDADEPVSSNSSQHSRRLVSSSFDSLLDGMRKRRKIVIPDNDSHIPPVTESNQSQPSDSSTECDNPLQGAGSSLFAFHSFLQSLLSVGDDARIIVYRHDSGAQPLHQHNNKASGLQQTTPTSQSHLKLTVLNPGRYLADLVNEARCVLLAGGTLQPFDELIGQVFLPAGKPLSEIVTFACGHVIDTSSSQRSQLAVYPICSANSQVELEFTHEVMDDYAKAIKTSLKGALMICVIGGKLSEGINFSDDLARAVVIVGLPYQNPHCPLLRAKMTYLDRMLGTTVSMTTSISPGRRCYEAACMRLINQAVGRAIRHASDYAVIFLLDKRFARPSIQAQLPGWVRQAVVAPGRFDQLASSRVDTFFRTQELVKGQRKAAL